MEFKGSQVYIGSKKTQAVDAETYYCICYAVQTWQTYTVCQQTIPKLLFISREKVLAYNCYLKQS
jgi:hypothetical protein